MNFITIVPFFIILAVDIYFTTFGSLRTIGIEIPEETGTSEENAKIFSVIVNSPAYIIGILAFLKMF